VYYVRAQEEFMSQRTGWTPEQLDDFCKRTGQGNPLNETNHRSPVSDTKPKRHKTPALGGAIQGEASGFQRPIVSFTGYRVKPLDPDNFAGSVKDLLDGLRHAQIIHGDEPWQIEFRTTQEKVKHYKDEKTVIEVITHE
jgi:hypothetical protein